MATKSKKEGQQGAAPMVRLTPAQRRKQQDERKQEELQVKRAAFESERELRWYRFLAHALILSQLTEGRDELREVHSWFFDSFHVEASTEEVTLESRTYSRADDSFSFETFERAESDLATGQQYFTDYLAEQERKREEEVRKQARRQSGLSKLTPDEIEALNISHLVPRSR